MQFANYAALAAISHTELTANIVSVLKRKVCQGDLERISITSTIFICRGLFLCCETDEIKSFKFIFAKASAELVIVLNLFLKFEQK